LLPFLLLAHAEASPAHARCKTEEASSDVQQSRRACCVEQSYSYMQNLT